MDFSVYDEPVQMVANFEDKVLSGLRVAAVKDVHSKKIKKYVEWAKLMDKLIGQIDSVSATMKQVDRLFLALIDNPRLGKEVILPFLPLIYDTEKLVNNAKLCLEQREDVRRDLLLNFPEACKTEGLRELLKSDRGEYSDIDINLVLFQESLLRKDCDKIVVIKRFLQRPDVKTEKDIRKALDVVKQIDATLLEKVHKSITTS